MTSTRPAHLAAGDVRARRSRLQFDDGRARRAMATMSDGRMILVADVERFRHRINTSGRNEGPNPCEIEIGLTADSVTQAQLRLSCEYAGETPADDHIGPWPAVKDRCVCGLLRSIATASARADRGVSRVRNRRPPRPPGSFRQPLSPWLRYWQGWQARSMRPAHPLPRRQWQQQGMLAFDFSCF